MKNILSILLLTTTFISAQVASDYTYTGAEATALAGAVVANPGNTTSLFHNPAGIAELDGLSLTSGQSNLYGLSYIPLRFIGCSWKSPWFGTIGLSSIQSSVEYLSTELSKEISISFSNGFYLLNDKNSKFMVGYSVNFMDWNLGHSAGVSGDASDGLDLGSVNAVGVDFGIQAVLREKHRVGVFIKNINSPTIGRGNSNQYLPRRMNVGIAYFPYPRLMTSLVAERLLGDSQLQIKSGIQYSINEIITLRFGLQSNPNRFGLGIVLRMNPAIIEYSLLTHPVLSATHNMSIGFSL